MLRVYLKIDESKQISQTAKRKLCSIRLQQFESWGRPAARGSGSLAGMDTQEECGAGHSCHWTSHCSSDFWWVLVFAVSSGREATWIVLPLMFCKCFLSSYHPSEKEEETQKRKPFFNWQCSSSLNHSNYGAFRRKLKIWCCWVPQVLVLCFRVCAHPKRAALLCVRAASMSLAVSELSGWEDLYLWIVRFRLPFPSAPFSWW